MTATQLAQFFKTALVSPVLTAHPTEVRRRTTMYWESDIVDLLRERERGQHTAQELAAMENQLRIAIETLWQSNLLRRSRLTVADEVTNGISYYNSTFLAEVPRLHQQVEEALAQHLDENGVPSLKFIQMGSWIGDKENGLWVREVRKLCQDGHQTSLVSSAKRSFAIRDAALIFSRWSQENFFAYMETPRSHTR